MSQTAPGDAHLPRLIDTSLELAERALRLGEVPIGAVVARGDGTIVGWGWNELIAKRDPTLHAEIVALRDAVGRYDPATDELILASTLEPCVMCAGAAYVARIATVAYALAAPADAGTARITPPQDPATRTPRFVGPVRPQPSLQLLGQWLQQHRDDNSLQARYVRQLLAWHE